MLTFEPMLFSRQLCDTLPSNPGNIRLRPEWVLTRVAREEALARSLEVREDQLSYQMKPLQNLEIGTIVQVKNQWGPHATKWDLSCTIDECQNFDSYLVKMDGSDRITKCNRKFIKLILPYSKLI